MPRFRSSSHPSMPTEPLFVLADLQEFGAPGQGVPISGPSSTQTDATTSTTTTPSQTPSRYKRFSDMSVASALSFRDDTKVDYTRTSTPVCTSLSARQQEPISALYRTGPFGAPLSPNITFDGDGVSIESLPIPRRRPPASPDAPPPPTSRRNACIFPPVTPRRPHLFSVMSASTEQDWLALMAEMPLPPRKPVPHTPPDYTSTGETAPCSMILNPLASAPASIPTRWSERSSGSLSSKSSFLSPLLQREHSFQPYYQVSFVPSSDSPLSSSCSSSPLRTPSLNRGSSPFSANIASPPVTPASTSSSSPLRDAAHPSSSGKLHSVVEESLFAEGSAIDNYRHARCSTDEAETIQLLDKDSEGSWPPSSSSHPPCVELPFVLDEGSLSLRSKSLSLDGNLNWNCEGESYVSLEALEPSKSKTDAESNPLPRNPRTGRRPPPLQLTRTGQISSWVPAPPACPPEGTFEVQSDLRSQRRSAYILPSNSRPPVSGSKPQRSSVILIEDVLEDAQQLFVRRETRTHSPFRRLRSQGSSDSLSPYCRERNRDSVNDLEDSSPYTPHTPEFAPPPSENLVNPIEFPRLSVDSPCPNDLIFSFPPYDKSPTPSRAPSYFTEPDHELEFAWPGVRKWRSQTLLPGSPSGLSPSPAPLSPAVSVHSDRSVTGSIRSGITKLLSIGMSGRNRGESKCGPAERGPGVRSSNSFDRPLPPSTTSTVSLGSLCTSRAEERRLRKEAARGRTESLAQELAERARKRAEAGKARRIAYIREKNLRAWEEAGAMYQGLSYL